MDRWPLVSIITPSYNQAEFLAGTLRSVAAQDYPRIEHVVIDGASTDGSVEIIRGHEGQLAFWTSEPDNGQSQAINRGFARATGSILAWLNSDDLLAPSAVRIAVERLRREPAVGLVYGDRVEIDRKGNITSLLRGPQYYPKMLGRNITIPQETAFFRRDAFERVGPLDETLHFAMDFDLWCRLSKVTELRHVPAFTGYFRRHGESKSVVFHGESRAATGYASEHATVFRRHFGRELPGPRAAWWNRFTHQLRLAREWRGAARAAEVKEIRALVESTPDPVMA